MPLYWVLPVPVLIAWYRYSSLPVVASVITWSWLGVPSSWRPRITVSQASFGVPSPAQITLRALSVVGFSAFRDFAAFRALVSAAALVKVAVVERTLIVRLLLKVVLTVPLATEAGGVCTTRSPPRTGSPA